jgi:tetratricopeptide (TPR) repeat protein
MLGNNGIFRFYYGSALTLTGQYEVSVEELKKSVHITPSKLYPKYLPAKLYMELSEYEEAEKWAQEILLSKEKVPTTAAREIKEEMEKFIQSRTNLK